MAGTGAAASRADMQLPTECASFKSLVREKTATFDLPALFCANYSGDAHDEAQRDGCGEGFYRGSFFPCALFGFA